MPRWMRCRTTIILVLAAHAGDAAVGSAMTVAMWRRCRAERRMVGLAGAVGAVLPDLESVLLTLGRMDAGRMRFPSHSGLIPHGRASYRTTLIFYAVAVAVSWVSVRPDRQSSRRPIRSERTYRNSLVAH